VTTIPQHVTEEKKETSDEGLIRQTLAGRRAAFSVLVSRHRTGIAALALRALGGNVDDAQDVTQETFLYAYQRLGDLRDPARFGPWLRSVTLSLCADHRRRKATRPLLPDALRYLPAPDGTGRDLAEGLVVRDALSRLTPAHRLTFTLFHVGGYAHAEIAALLNIPVNTVRSRLQTARRLLRASLHPLFPERKLMTASAPLKSAALVKRDPLPPAYENLIRSTFPDSRILAAERNPETWMPFAWRIRLALPDETERSVDVRAFASILTYYGAPAPDANVQARLFAALQRLGLPVPELLAGPFPDPENAGSLIALTAKPTGGNLLLMTLDSNLPHRIRAATALVIEAIDRLHGLTDALLADPVGQELPRRPLSVDLSELVGRGGPWLADPLFAEAVKRLTPLVQQISDATPLVYTNDLYFPSFLRAESRLTDTFVAPFGWPGDPRATSGQQITEYVLPFGWFGDPILGVAKFWTYDCYPFVHTGFVERYLYEKGITRREFAPRLAVRALWTLQRELPVARPAEGPEYWDSLVGLLKHALDSLD